MQINEKLIQYLWKSRLLYDGLKTIHGEPVIVLHPGTQNSDGGPDFFNARVCIGETTWAGNVEIHVNASDWYRHHHHHDRAYDNIILHVVYEADRTVTLPNQQPVPTMEVKDCIPVKVVETYEQILRGEHWIPCAKQLTEIDASSFKLWSAALTIERLEKKASEIRHLYLACNRNWEETCYRHLALCFGFKTNALPFELLAKSLPLRYLLSNRDDLYRLEALLFGQAGMLESTFTESYPRRLTEDYLFLREKYGLAPNNSAIWKFLRLRPANFPTIRISQFAQFILKTEGKFFAMVEEMTLEEVRNSFDVKASDYWDTHFLFDKPSVSQTKVMGQSSIQLLLINAWAIFLFFYGLEKNLPQLREKALQSLEHLHSENSADLTRWKMSGVMAENALQSQALIQLKEGYCNKFRCLECRLGGQILGKKGGC